MFMDEEFLLSTDIAKTLYHEGVSRLPVIDYHCHVDPRAIAEDICYEDIAQLWLGGDHYKWRLMRWCGVEERLVTGNAPGKEKFLAFAACLPKAMGNPVYSWVHLELKRYFDCQDVLDAHSAERVWEQCNQKLRNGLSVRGLIEQSNVSVICTTDDPTDDLHWHREIAASPGFETGVYPTFRPDRALQIDKPGFAAYIGGLGRVWGGRINSLDDLFAALCGRLDVFVELGCRLADHGLEAVPWSAGGPDPGAVFKRRLAGDMPTPEEARAYQAELLLFLGREYHRRRMVMQVHYGALRNVNPALYRGFGPDAGCDCMDGAGGAKNIALLLGALAEDGALPKTILYALNPADNAMLACLAGAFQKAGTAGWVQQGSAWWFNDAKSGIEAQLTTLAETGALGCFVGMLTDSRSFTSYVRHEYFRRIACNLIGNWVSDGTCPSDMGALFALAQGIAYHNAREYFGFAAL